MNVGAVLAAVIVFVVLLALGFGRARESDDPIWRSYPDSRRIVIIEREPEQRGMLGGCLQMLSILLLACIALLMGYGLIAAL